jgi:hypothetical protein
MRNGAREIVIARGQDGHWIHFSVCDAFPLRSPLIFSNVLYRNYIFTIHTLANRGHSYGASGCDPRADLRDRRPARARRHPTDNKARPRPLRQELHPAPRRVEGRVRRPRAREHSRHAGWCHLRRQDATAWATSTSRTPAPLSASVRPNRRLLASRSVSVCEPLQLGGGADFFFLRFIRILCRGTFYCEFL